MTVSAAELTTTRQQPPTAGLEWYLAVAPYGDAVFTARVNDPGGTIDDPNMDIPYDAGVGSVEAGMTLWVGSSAGGRDVGRVRVRADASGASGTLDVAENYEIDWDDDLYLTAPGEGGFREIWSVLQIVEDDGTIKKDYDIDYASAGDTGKPGENIKPKANAGPPACKFIGSSGYVDIDFYAEHRKVYGAGETITTYTWDFKDGAVQSWGAVDPGSGAVHMGSEANPNVVRFSSAGFRYVELTVTCDNGETGTVYIPVWTFDDNNPPITNFEVLNQECTKESGWGARFAVYDADNDTVYDFPEHALVVLFTKSDYGSGWESVGGYTDRKNVRFVGWIDEETMTFDFEKGGIEFQCISHDARIANLFGLGFVLNDSTDPESEDYDPWNYATSLNVDRAVQWFREWHTTINQVCHVEDADEGTDREFERWVSAETNRYNQMQEDLLVDAHCKMMSDRQGVLHITINPQFVLHSDHGGTRPTEVCTVGRDDWMGEIDASRVTGRTGQVKIGGFAGETALASWAPGDVPGDGPEEYRKQGFIVADQDEMNYWSGYEYANRNNPYPEVVVPLVGFWDFLDPAYQDFIKLDAVPPALLDRAGWSAGDKFVVRGVRYVDMMEATDLTCLTEITIEKETVGEPGVTKEVPELPEPDLPDYDPIPPEPPPTPVPPGWPEEPNMAMVWTKSKVAWCYNVLAAGGPTWIDVGSGISGSIRGIYLMQTSDTMVGAWCVTSSKVYYSDSVMDSDDISWNEKYDLATFDAGMSPSYNHGESGSFVCGAVWTKDPDYFIVGVRHGGGTFGPYRYPGYGAYTGGFAYTNDRGSSWSLSSMPSDNRGLWEGGWTNGCLLGKGIGIDQNTGTIVAVRDDGIYGSSYGVVYSTNGGVSFSKSWVSWCGRNAATGFYGAGVVVVPLMESGKAYYYASPAIEGYCDIGPVSGSWTPWTTLRPSSDYRCVSCVGMENWTFDANLVVCVMETKSDNKRYIYKTTDGGLTWTAMSDTLRTLFETGVTGSTAAFVGGWPGDRDFWWAVATESATAVSDKRRILYTDDAGLSWNDINGNWYAEMGDWNGGHTVGLVPLPRIGANA